MDVKLEGNINFKNYDKLLERAIYRSYRRASQSAKADIVKNIPNIYDIKSATLRTKMSSKIKDDELQIKGSPIDLFKYKVSPNAPRQEVVHASVKRMGGNLDHAFIAKMGSHIGVYERTGKKRFSVRQLYSLSAAQMSEEPQVLESAMLRASQVIGERFDHELERLLNE